MAVTRSLLELQSLDTAIDTLFEEKENLPEKAAYLQLSGRLTKIEEGLQSVKQRLIEEEVKKKKLEIEATELSQKIKEGETRLYSGLVKNEKEQHSLEHELAFNKKTLDDVETVLLEQIELIDHEQSTQTKLVHEKEHLVLEVQKAKALVEKRIADLKMRYDDLLAQKKAVLPLIDPEIQPIYDDLRKKKRGIAAVRVKGVICQGCHTNLPEDEIELGQASDAPWYCSACGRIIVAEQ